MWEQNGKYSLTIFKPHSKENPADPIHFEGVMSAENIISHVVESIWPHVMTFSGRESVTRLYGHQKGGHNDAFLVIFTENFEGTAMKIVEKIAKKQFKKFGKGGLDWKGRQTKRKAISRENEPIIFVRSGYAVDNSDPYQVRFAKEMGADGESIFLGKVVNFNLVKFKYTGEVTEEGLSRFIEDWRSHKLEVHLKSEPVPERQPFYGLARKIVGDNYLEEVVENEKFVLVLYHERWVEGHLS